MQLGLKVDQPTRKHARYHNKEKIPQWFYHRIQECDHEIVDRGMALALRVAPPVRKELEVALMVGASDARERSTEKTSARARIKTSGPNVCTYGNVSFAGYYWFTRALSGAISREQTSLTS